MGLAFNMCRNREKKGEITVMRKALRGIVLGAIGLGFAIPATAAITWNFTSGLTQGGNVGTYGNTRSKTVDGVMVTASGWSNTVNAANTNIESAYVGSYSGGLGVTNRDGANGTDANEGTPAVTIAPEHAVDNNERTDAVLLHFDSAVKLLELAIGYVGSIGEADITVLASNGLGLSGKIYGDLAGTDPNSLVAAGWDFIGNLADVTTSSSKQISTSLYRTDWLILAYNPDFGTGPGLKAGHGTPSRRSDDRRSVENAARKAQLAPWSTVRDPRRARGFCFGGPSVVSQGPPARREPEKHRSVWSTPSKATAAANSCPSARSRTCNKRELPAG